MYKVEDFVEKCLHCLTEQNIPKEEFEIICINDGSPDNSREIVLRFQKTFDNIILIDQENQGVSCARNNGIERSKGKYLLFIDPDDYVEKNSFKRILKLIDKNEAQVAFLGFTVLDEDNTINSKVYHEEYTGQIKTGIESYYNSHEKGRADPDRIYGILFESSLINKHNFRFLKGVPYLEDGEILTRILCIATQCIFIEGPFYWRTTRPGSATNSNLFNSKYAIDGFIKSAVNLRNFRDSVSLTKEQKEFMNQPVIKYVILSFSAAGNIREIRKMMYVYSSLKKNNFDKLDLQGCNPMYTKLGNLYNISILLLCLYLLIRPIGLSYRNRLAKIRKIF